MEQKFIITKTLGDKIAQFLGNQKWVDVNGLLQEFINLQPYIEPVVEKVEEKVTEEKG